MVVVFGPWVQIQNIKINPTKIYDSETSNRRTHINDQRGPVSVMSFLKLKAKRKTGLTFKNYDFVGHLRGSVG